jgi:hypothetical protein
MLRRSVVGERRTRAQQSPAVAAHGANKKLSLRRRQIGFARAITKHVLDAAAVANVAIKIVLVQTNRDPPPADATLDGDEPV